MVLAKQTKQVLLKTININVKLIKAKNAVIEENVREIRQLKKDLRNADNRIDNLVLRVGEAQDIDRRNRFIISNIATDLSASIVEVYSKGYELEKNSLDGRNTCSGIGSSPSSDR